MGESTQRALKAVVFDLGNVLIRWDPLPAITAGVGADEAMAFLAADDFDFMAWNHEQDAGRTWDEGEAVAVAAHPRWEAAIRAYRANFAASLIGPVQDAVVVVEELHEAEVPLFALTNWSAELFPQALERFDFLDLFEDIIVSGEEGAAKPDREIFTALERRTRHRGGLDHLVFVDDTARNVQAALELGMAAILFTDTGQLRDDLRSRGLPLRYA